MSEYSPIASGNSSSGFASYKGDGKRLRGFTQQFQSGRHWLTAPLSVHLVHDDNKDKDFELEMTWVCAESKFKHALVPADLLKEAEEKAKAALEEGMEED